VNGKKKTFHLDAVSVVATSHDCKAEKYQCGYKDESTASVKTKVVGLFLQGGKWVDEFFKDATGKNQENRRAALQGVLTKIKRSDDKIHDFHFDEELDTSLKPKITCVPDIVIRKNPLDTNSTTLAMVNVVIITFKFLEETDLEVEQDINQTMGSLSIGM